MKIKGRKISIRQIIFLCLFYGILRHLPASTCLVGGRIFRFLRRWCCSHIFEFCGKDVNVEHGAFFASGVRLRIGDRSGLGINCHVPGNIHIGKDVMMGPNCYILDANHAFDRTDIPMINQGLSASCQTIIEDDVWIGRDVVFTPGRHVSSGSIIAARCCLCKDFPPFAVVGGNPARLIRLRK